MKNLAKLINVIVIIQFAVMIFNVGELRCQESSSLANSQDQAEYLNKIPQVLNNDNVQDDKNVGVTIIELVIKQNLNNRYQRLEPEELEEILYKRR